MCFSGRRVDVKIQAFWGMMLCRLLHCCRHVRGACCVWTALKVEAVSLFKTSVNIYQFSSRHIPQYF